MIKRYCCWICNRYNDGLGKVASNSGNFLLFDDNEGFVNRYSGRWKVF